MCVRREYIGVMILDNNDDRWVFSLGSVVLDFICLVNCISVCRLM